MDDWPDDDDPRPINWVEIGVLLLVIVVCSYGLLIMLYGKAGVTVALP